MSKHPTHNERKPEFLKLHADYPDWSFNRIANHMGLGKNIILRWVTENGLRTRCVPTAAKLKAKRVKLIDYVPRAKYPPDPPFSEVFREEYDRLAV